jgi:hypothetical protein
MVFPHEAQYPLLVHRPLLHDVQRGSDPAVAPERVFGFELLKPAEQAFMALGNHA